MSDNQMKQAGMGQLGEILQRIDERLRELKLSQRAAARKAGLSPAQIRTMRRQYAEGKQHGASVRTISGLAQALNLMPGWLMSGTGPKESVPSEAGLDRSGRGLRFAGAVAAGVWNESGSDQDQPRRVPVPPDLRYPAEFQSAYEVRGPSMDRVARAGDYLIVVDRKKLGLPLRSDDLVIMTQAKEGLREVTARRYRSQYGRHFFAFESTEPRYNSGVGLTSLDDNDSFQIGGVVVAVYRSLA